MKHTTQKHIALIVFTLLFTGLFAQNAKLFSSKHLSSSTPQVLLIGNSYFQYNDQPTMLRAMCDSAGQPAMIGSYLKSGTALIDHTQDRYALDKIASREWDQVVVIGGARGVAYPQDFPDIQTYASVLTLQGLARAANDSARLVYVMPWAFEDGMLWMGWEDDYAAMQQKIYTNALRWTYGNDFVVSPAGAAWHRVLDSLNYPLHYLHLEDWNHPSPKGSYLLCCVLYCSIFQDSCTDNSYTAGLPESEARWYRELATEIVLSDPDKWNLPSVETALRDYRPQTPDPALLLESYPNPFNPRVNLTLSAPSAQRSNTVPSAQRSVLSIYDLQGKLVKVLHEGYLDAGEHEFHWDASDVPAGVYVVRAQAGRDVVTKKIVYLP